MVRLLPEHRLAELSEVTEDDLAESSLILLNEEHCPNEAILDACGSPERHVACLGADLRATSIETVRRMVAASGGCTLLPALSLLASPQSQRRLEICPYKGRHDFRRVGLVWRKSCPRGEEMALLARLIRQNLPEGVRVVSEVAA